jgi:outer membrane protein
MSKISLSKVSYGLSKSGILALAWAGWMFAGEAIKLSPEKVVELARTQSIAVKASEGNLKAMEEAKKSAFSAFLPSVSASASAMHVIDKAQFELGGSGGGGGIDPSMFTTEDLHTLSLMKTILDPLMNMKIETPNNLYSAGFTVAQPLYAGGRIKANYRRAQFSLSAQKWTHERTLKEIGLSAVQLYWVYVNSLKQLDALKETEQWFETVIGDQQKMFEQGIIIELDVLNSKIQLDNTKLGRVKLENALATIGANLLLFLDLPADGAIEADTTALAAAPSAFSAQSEDDIEKTINSREDVLALMNQIEALKAVRCIQSAAYLPTLSALYNFSYTNQYSTREKDMKRSSAVGASINWNLFDGGKGQHEKKATEYQIETLHLQLDNLRSQIRLKIRELGRKVDENANACDIARKDLEISRKALDIAQKKYDAQAITNTELLMNRNQLTSKMVGFSQARINAILALEEYKVAAVTVASTSSATGQMETNGR